MISRVKVKFAKSHFLGKTGQRDGCERVTKKSDQKNDQNERRTAETETELMMVSCNVKWIALRPSKLSLEFLRSPSVLRMHSSLWNPSSTQVLAVGAALEQVH